MPFVVFVCVGEGGLNHVVRIIFFQTSDSSHKEAIITMKMNN
jgi:hypothetical protein